MSKTRATAGLSLSFPAVFAVAALALLLFVPAALSDTAPLSWSAPTPADQSRFSATTGSRVAFSLAASTTVPDSIVHIAPARSLPKGAVFNATDGSLAHGSFSWKPERAGDYSVQFAASTAGATTVAPTLTYVIHVRAKVAKVQYPRSYKLADEKVAHWAAVLRRAVVRAKPSLASRAVTTLDTWTTDDTQNIVLVLNGTDVKAGQTWYRVRLPILPNNSVGWVQARYLGDLYTVHTHLYVNRATMTATLKRDGVTVFKSVVGVGKSVWPTPRGEFYIRDKMTSFASPVYGPIAFGTSARSPVLTDWPGGGFVGVHGTNEPGILPGRVSHGCIRMPNASILKLARLMPVGTPLTVS
jgi:lipoprotein-anchoring transpeptidase ErfK/SrfK